MNLNYTHQSLEEKIQQLLEINHVSLKIGYIPFLSSNMIGAANINPSLYLKRFIACERVFIKNLKEFSAQVNPSKLKEVLNLKKFITIDTDRSENLNNSICNADTVYFKMFYPNHNSIPIIDRLKIPSSGTSFISSNRPGEASVYFYPNGICIKLKGLEYFFKIKRKSFVPCLAREVQKKRWIKNESKI